MVRSGRAGIGGREGDEDVAGAVAGDAAVAAEPQRNPAREAFELMRDERRVRCNNNNDRAVVVVHEGCAGIRIITSDFSADRNPGNAQIVFRAVVALHKNSNRVSAIFRLQLARSRADSSFESVADHSRAAANIAFLNGAGRRSVDGAQSMLGPYMETVDVVEPSIPGFRDDWQCPPITGGIRLTGT